MPNGATLSALIWSRNSFMKSLVIHRSNLTWICQRCTTVFIYFFPFSREPTYSTFVRTCKCVSLCELHADHKARPVLMFCMFMEQNSHAEMKPTPNWFYSQKKLFFVFSFDRVLIFMVRRYFSGARQFFWLIALTASSCNDFPYQY